MDAGIVRISSGSPEAQRYPDCPKPVKCVFCGALRYTKGTICLGSVVWHREGPERCTCPEALAAHERELKIKEQQEAAEHKVRADALMKNLIAKNIGESGLSERALRRTFESFHVTADNKSAYATCSAFARDFESKLPKSGQPEPGRNGLLIVGSCGTGKTHLAFAIANELLSHGTQVIAMTALELLSKIKRTYSKSGIDEDDILRVYGSVPLLIIDDLGKEKASEWTAATIYSIIDRRYNNLLPVVITTNYGEQELIQRLTPVGAADQISAIATVDRLSEICAAVPLVSPSWRKR